MIVVMLMLVLMLMLMVVIVAAAGAVLVMLVMMLVLLMVMLVVVLMLMFVLIMLVVMVVMMMLVVRLVRDLLENLRNEVAAAFHGGEQLLAGQVLPRGGDDAGVLIQAAQHGNGLVEALLRALSRAGQQDGLILEKLTEVLEIHLSLERVNNGYKAVQLNLEVRVLYRSDNIRQLADAGRLDQDAVRMVLVHNIVQRLAEVANQRAADAACVHLVYNNAGILEETAVNADLTELVLDQNNLLTLERIGQQTLDEGRLAGTQKTGNNINFSHALSLHFYARHRDSRTVLKFFERLYYTTFIEKRKVI